MISKEKILLIAAIVLVLIIGVSNISRFIPESKNYQKYEEALRKYNNNSYQDAYYLFGKVSRFSKIKSAATFRQALCASKLGDKKTEASKYRELMRNYPGSLLSLRSDYLYGQLLYESKNYKKSQKIFKNIVIKYPTSDYAVAAKYYLGALEAEKSKYTKNTKTKIKAQKNAISYFKAYLKDAPQGRYAISCIQKWLELKTHNTNEDNLVIARVYMANEDYVSARKFLKYTNVSMSWPYFVQNEYHLGNYPKARYYTELGIKGKASDEILINEDIDEKTQSDNIYKAIDIYLKLSPAPRTSISYLLEISNKSRGYDYLLFKNCNNLPVQNQTACFNTLYYQYPKGQFAAESLANIFYDKVKSQKYFKAKEFGRKHLADFPQANSAPKVMFWLGKVSERSKHYEEARSYYRGVIRQYPDDYYAYRAFLSLNRFRRFQAIRLTPKPIEFPYKNFGYGIITELAKVKDYGLVNQLCKDDKFVQSWLLFKEGDFSSSSRIARDAMDKIQIKPERTDVRWRLVYPIHYYPEILRYSRSWNNEPVMILSIIREESYFNPTAKSFVGASGLMQLMPSTAREVAAWAGTSLPNDSLLFDPDINIKLGNMYYAQLKRMLLNKDILAVLAYNGGIGSVSNWKENLNYIDVDDFIEQIPYSETQNYLKKVYRSYWNYLRIYDGVRF